MNRVHRRSFVKFSAGALGLLATAVAVPAAWAADEAPDAMIQRLSSEVLQIIKTDAAVQNGDIERVMAVVDSKIMPNVNFSRMTSMAVGRAWRQATPEQQKQLQDEFKTLLVRTYAGALGEVRDQTLSFKPMRAKPEDTEVVVRTEVRGKGEPIQLDYRLEKMSDGWKIYDLNVLGVWLIETYKSQFAQEINSKGIDGLIANLVQRNKAAAGTAKAS